MTFMMLIFAVTFVVIQQKTIDIRNQQTQRQAEALANVIQNEAYMAELVHYGYRKCFWIPEFINGEEYTIEIKDDKDLVIQYKDKTYFSFLNITKGVISLDSMYNGYHTTTKNSSGIFIDPGRNC